MSADNIVQLVIALLTVGGAYAGVRRAQKGLESGRALEQKASRAATSAEQYDELTTHLRALWDECEHRCRDCTAELAVAQREKLELRGELLTAEREIERLRRGEET